MKYPLLDVYCARLRRPYFIPHFKHLAKVTISMYSINCISRLYCDNPKLSNTPISVSFDYRKMKNVEMNWPVKAHCMKPRFLGLISFWKS